MWEEKVTEVEGGLIMHVVGQGASGGVITLTKTFLIFCPSLLCQWVWIKSIKDADLWGCNMSICTFERLIPVLQTGSLSQQFLFQDCSSRRPS